MNSLSFKINIVSVFAIQKEILKLIDNFQFIQKLVNRKNEENEKKNC